MALYWLYAAVLRRQGHRTSLATRALTPTRPEHQRAALRTLLILDAAENLDDVGIPPGNRLEKLRGDRSGQYSIRVNQQWRICFRWSAAGPEDIEITDYH